ncbi:MAG TPA: histone deacetylase [Anaeromyxobacteraceae bacterium]|nr:histone deacetylase [Anaeromyxobacteraceae bacterium]
MLGVGPRALLYRLRCLLKRREVDVWYDPAYRLPFTGAEFSGLDPRRADFAAWWLRESKAIAAPWWRTPRRASYAELARVHEPALLESLSRPETLAGVFAVDPTDVPVDEVMRTVRLATGATVQAAGEALRRNRPQLNLLGGFHHAGPASAGGFCPVNDIAVAVAAVRADGFSGTVAVLDLDAHPPDGLAACLASDPAHWIGSISASEWTPLPGVDEVLLPEATGNERYISALQGLLSRMPPAGLAFVIAGGDVLRGDRLGKLDLTLGGVRLRNVAVAAHLEGVPSVWLPGGGYSKNAWKALAGAGIALSTGSLDPIPEDYDPITSRFAEIAAGLSKDSLSGSGELTDEDLAEALGMRPTRQRLLLGFYTEAGIEFALQRYGILDQLRRLGYDDFRVEFARQPPGERIRVYGKAEGQEHVLLEVVLEKKRIQDHPVLYIHWLSLRHPRAQFSERRPRLPGQEVPGLGLARETGEMLALMALRLQLTGVAYRPAHYHTAFAGRHHFSFVDAERQGRFDALVRDTKGMSLLDATRAIDEGRVLKDGAPYAWEPDEMVLWLREHPEERGEVALERDRTRFTVLPATPEPAGL